MNISFSLGTLAGSTALSIALVLPQDGQMVTIVVKSNVEPKESIFRSL